MNIYITNRHADFLRNIAGAILLLAVCAACHTVDADTPTHAYPHPPKWVHDKTMYQVNLRQFSQTGDLTGFRAQLPRLKELGVGVLWFMPVHPIGVVARSGELGSPYAVKDFTAFNPEFGTIEEFKALVDEAHELGMYVLIDWVANHTSPDHPWVNEHPNWYTRDDAGNLVPPVELWQDVVDLNFDSKELRQAMIDAMAFWVREVGIDGFRCDTAEWVPLDFWCDARDTLWRIKPVHMLAEGAKPELMDYAFDAAYAWDLTPNMHEIKLGNKTVTDLVNYLNAEARIVPNDGFRLNFTTNHDINAWEATAVERFGAGLETFTVLTFTVTGMPLIYNGQEARLDKRLDFFAPDPIEWRTDPLADLYQSLSQLKTNNPALWHGGAGAPLQIIKESTNESILAFQRQTRDDHIIVILNLSNEPHIVPAPEGINGLHQVLNNPPLATEGDTIHIQPWGYSVWSSTPLEPNVQH